MTKKRALGISIVGAGLLILLACSGFSGMTTEVAPYRGDSQPPYWMCATATFIPTDTPLPTASPMSSPTPVPGTTPLPWAPSDPTPRPTYTPYPTPTPYMRTGTFFRNQNIFIKVKPYRPAPPTIEGAFPEDSYLRVRLEHYTPLGPSRVNPEQTCIEFAFNLKNMSDVPLDVDLPNQVFLSFRDNPEVYFAFAEAFEEWGFEYPEARFGAQESRTVSIPICKIGNEDEKDTLRLGVLTTLNESRAGMNGLEGDIGLGSDTAIYIDFWQWDPNCSYPPELGLYPEVENPPAPSGYLPTSPMGGRFSGDEPVSMPPCLYITRGFGCDAFPTGVSGAGRCPATKPYWHTGIDYSCYEGTAIYNVIEGQIVHWGDGEGYGNLVIVQGRGRQSAITSMYAHLSAFSSDPLCSGLGNACIQGVAVGGVGNTGFSTGNHLHWEVRVNNVPVDPYLYFGGSQGQAPVFHDQPALLADASSGLLTLLNKQDDGPKRYPLAIKLRDADGQFLSGPSVILKDIDGEQVTRCQFTNGRCVFELVGGVYSLELAGELADGTPVHAYGELNLEAMQSQRAEYHHGPLALWHEGPRTEAGLVLVRDETGGAAQPYLDAAPKSDEPSPLNPMEHLAPEDTPTPAPDQQADGNDPDGAPASGMWPTLTPTPTVHTSGVRSEYPGWLLFVIALAVLGLIAGALWLGQWLKKGERGHEAS